MNLEIITQVNWVPTDFCRIESPENSLVTIQLDLIKGEDLFISTFDFEVNKANNMLIVPNETNSFCTLRNPKEIKTFDPDPDRLHKYDVFWTAQFADTKNFHLLRTALRRHGLTLATFSDLRNWMKKPNIIALNKVLNLNNATAPQPSKTLVAGITPSQPGNGTFDGFIFQDGVKGEPRRQGLLQDLFARKILINRIRPREGLR